MIDESYWVIRDAETGLFYRTTEYSFWYDPRDGGTRPRPNYSVYPYAMEQKLSKAKKHKDLGKAKITIINIVGYHGHNDPVPPGAPSWAHGCSDPHPFVRTLEAVKIDKATKAELEVVPLAPWFDTLMEGRKVLVIVPHSGSQWCFTELATQQNSVPVGSIKDAFKLARAKHPDALIRMHPAWVHEDEF